jgi:hypothetical protein
MMGALNDTAAVEDGKIYKTENSSEQEMPDQLQMIDSIDLVKGGSNNTAAMSKIAGAVIVMSHYSYEEQTCGK